MFKTKERKYNIKYNTPDEEFSSSCVSVLFFSSSSFDNGTCTIIENERFEPFFFFHKRKQTMSVSYKNSQRVIVILVTLVKYQNLYQESCNSSGTNEDIQYSHLLTLNYHIIKLK